MGRAYSEGEKASPESEEEKEEVMAKRWIQKAIKSPGSLRKTLGAKPGKDISEKKLKAAASGKYGPKTEKRAHLAETLKKLRKK